MDELSDHLTIGLLSAKLPCMVKFKRIERKRKSTYAAEQILDAIRQGEYHVGDKLPPEREIAEQMGVSRASLREALSALQLAGIIESRSGAGTYVLKAGFAEEYRALTLLEESENLQETFEARRVLEEGIVKLACKRVSAQDLQTLAEVLSKMQQSAQVQDFDVFNQANQRFHLTIVTATHNCLLVHALKPLLEVMRGQLPRELREKYYRADGQHFQRTFEIHRQIFQAVEKKDGVQAVRKMAEHFDMLERDLNE